MTWIRKKKKYSRPRKPFDKPRIEEENKIVEKYGLKNKKEVWKSEAAIDKVRSQAKKLIAADSEKQEILINKLKRMGFQVEKISDILSLDRESWLKRRLQTIVVEKKLATTPKQARQLIVHKHVMLRDSIVNVPSYMVDLEEENLISLVKKTQKKVAKADREKQVEEKPAVAEEVPVEEKKEEVKNE